MVAGVVQLSPANRGKAAIDADVGPAGPAFLVEFITNAYVWPLDNPVTIRGELTGESMCASGDLL